MSCSETWRGFKNKSAAAIRQMTRDAGVLRSRSRVHARRALIKLQEWVIHGVDAEGNVILRRHLKRRYVLAFFEKLPPCLIGMEACLHWMNDPIDEQGSYGSFLAPRLLRFLAERL